MTRNTSFNLGDHFSSFIEKQVMAGRYGNASEVLRAALRLLEEREARVTALRQALAEGEASGRAEAIDFDDFISLKRSSHGGS